jgi:hypothetical protein
MHKKSGEEVQGEKRSVNGIKSKKEKRERHTCWPAGVIGNSIVPK